MSNIFNYFALLAALVVGYGIFASSTDDEDEPVDVLPELQGYYLRDAVITETTASGTPHFRVAAFEVAQNSQSNKVALTGLRVDYLKTDAEAADGAAGNHWVLNADRGVASEDFRELELESNVQAHNLGAAQSVVLETEALTVDMDKQTARSTTDVDILFDGNRAKGRGFFVNLAADSLKLEGAGSIRLAQVDDRSNDATNAQASLPDIFTFEEMEKAAAPDNTLTMKKVRSITPPYIAADRAQAKGVDLANNRIVLSGNVRLELPKQGQLTADTAIVTLRDNKVTAAHVASETPEKLVEFEHRAKDSGKLIRGRAETIDYDVAKGTLQLRRNVRLTDERDEWNMDELDYTIATEAWRGKNIKGILNPRPKNSTIPGPAATP
jgi:LPS export ABC transporter protein LptC/lipopolysaccharide transport protein LptA